MARFHGRTAVVVGPLNFRSGGIARSAALQADMLRDLGFRARLVGTADAGALDGEGEHDHDVIAHEADESVDPHALVQRLGPMLAETDVVLFNGHWRPLNLALAAACRRVGIPYVVSSRNELSWAHRESHGSPSPSDVRAEEAFVRGATFLHMTAVLELEQALFPGGFRPRVEVMPNPVDVDPSWVALDRAAARRHLGVDSVASLLLSYGRVVAEKNPTWPIRMLPHLPDRCVLAVVGPADGRWRHEQPAIAHRLGVADRVVFHGFVGGLDRGRWLRAADVALVPSFSENFCLALAEAVLCGTPCLSSPAVGALEFLPEGTVAVEPLVLKRWVERCLALLEGGRRPALGVVEALTLRAAAEAWAARLHPVVRTSVRADASGA